MSKTEDKMELVKTEGTNLAVLDTDQEIDGDLAWNIAQYIAEAENDVRVAKGKFWMRCKRGTREEICDRMVALGYKGWGYSNMQTYAAAVSEISENFRKIDPTLYITHWQMLKNSGVGKKDRPQWIQKAIDEGLTPKLTIEAVAEMGEDVAEERAEAVRKILKEKGIKPKGKTEKELKVELKEANRKKAQEFHQEATKGKVASTEITLATACQFVGLSELKWIAKDTLDIIYKAYAKRFHPDINGNSGEEMEMLNRCHEKLKKIVR